MKKILAATATVVALVAMASPASAKTKALSSCTTALEASDQVMTIYSEVAIAQRDFFTEMSRAADVAKTNPTITGLTTFVQSMTGSTTSLTAKVRAANDRLTTLTPVYRTNRDACRAGK